MGKVNISSELVRKIADGDATSFRQLYDMHYSSLFIYARTFIDYEDAKDVMAEVFSKVWQSPQMLVNIDNVPSYLKTAVRNGCINFLRYEKYVRTNQKELHNLLTQDQNEEFELSQLIADAYEQIAREVENLPTQEKRIFQLSYLQGFKNAEIADMLGISEQTVRNAKTKALSKLRIAFERKPWLLLILCFLER
jgi:RNA polymerase sigma-70 factor (family 1)